MLGKHTKKIKCGCWSKQNLLALAGDDHSLSVSNSDGDTVKQFSLQGDPSDVQFSEMKADERSSFGENTVSSRDSGSSSSWRRSRGAARIWSRRTLMQIVPSQIFLIWVQKGVLCCLQNMSKSVFEFFCPGPLCGSSRRSTDPLVGWGGDTPPHPTPLSTDPPSALTKRPPRIPARCTSMSSSASCSSWIGM